LTLAVMGYVLFAEFAKEAGAGRRGRGRRRARSAEAAFLSVRPDTGAPGAVFIQLAGGDAAQLYAEIGKQLATTASQQRSIGGGRARELGVGRDQAAGRARRAAQ
jgi:hypothetical protein